jgi:hypothetical protein
MDDFLNSKSMITPGVAGGVVTLVAATLSSQFGWPAKWIAIVASLLIALLIFFADQAGKMIARAIVLLLNTVIIFSVAVGANASAMTAATAKPSMHNMQYRPGYESGAVEPTPTPTPTPFFHPWF